MGGYALGLASEGQQKSLRWEGVSSNPQLHLITCNVRRKFILVLAYHRSHCKTNRRTVFQVYMKGERNRMRFRSNKSDFQFTKTCFKTHLIHTYILRFLVTFTSPLKINLISLTHVCQHVEFCHSLILLVRNFQNIFYSLIQVFAYNLIKIDQC